MSTYLLVAFAGVVCGGLFGCMIMALMNTASRADDAMREGEADD